MGTTAATGVIALDDGARRDRPILATRLRARRGWRAGRDKMRVAAGGDALGACGGVVATDVVATAVVAVTGTGVGANGVELTVDPVEAAAEGRAAGVRAEFCC